MSFSIRGLDLSKKSVLETDASEESVFYCTILIRLFLSDTRIDALTYSACWLVCFPSDIRHDFAIRQAQ